MFYLASIAQPSTKTSTVKEILYKVKEKAEVLRNKEADLLTRKLDHAVSQKL